MFFSKPSYEHFVTQTQKYIDELFSGYDRKTLVVLDHHPLPIQFAEKLNDYFGPDAKMIVVDRDPRDIYCDLVNHKNRIGRELSVTHDVTKYVEWYKALHAVRPNSDRILYLQFEELVNNYDNEIMKIFHFIDVDEVNHIRKRKFFDPSVSKNNVGIWKKQKSIPLEVFEKMETLLKL